MESQKVKVKNRVPCKTALPSCVISKLKNMVVISRVPDRCTDIFSFVILEYQVILEEKELSNDLSAPFATFPKLTHKSFALLCSCAKPGNNFQLWQQFMVISLMGTGRKPRPFHYKYYPSLSPLALLHLKARSVCKCYNHQMGYMTNYQTMLSMKRHAYGIFDYEKGKQILMKSYKPNSSLQVSNDSFPTAASFPTDQLYFVTRYFICINTLYNGGKREESDNQSFHSKYLGLCSQSCFISNSAFRYSLSIVKKPLLSQLESTSKLLYFQTLATQSQQDDLEPQIHNIMDSFLAYKERALLFG